jgi:hypothetical protein
MILVTGFPNGHNFVNRDKARLLVFILQVKHRAFDPDHFTPQT